LGAAQVDHYRPPKTELSLGDPRQLSLENRYAQTGVHELDETSYRNRDIGDAADQCEHEGHKHGDWQEWEAT